VSCAKPAVQIHIQNTVKNAETGWFTEPCIRWDAHWRNLANTIEPSVYGCDTALCQINYYDRLFYSCHTWIKFRWRNTAASLTRYSLSCCLYAPAVCKI